jgi:hypothetical protein
MKPPDETMKTISFQLSLALLAGIANGQEPRDDKGMRPPQPVPPVIGIFDRDHDGMLSAAEIQDAAAVLAKLDRNGDGNITREEALPPRPPRDQEPRDGGPQRPPAQPRPIPLPAVMAALDKNKDRALSPEELEAAPESLLQLDENGDGALSPEEIFPPGPPPPGGDRGRGPHPQGPPPDGDPMGPPPDE